MSDPESNPFADPHAENPFADPSITAATSTTSTSRGGLEEFNPFANQAGGNRAAAPPTQPVISSAAVIETKSEPAPPPYQDLLDEEQENLKRRQEELERKAAELQAKEQELRQMQYATRENNFPPLPAKFCFKPCFYHDISVEIPLEYQRTCKLLFYLWVFYSFTLLLNVIGCIAYLVTGIEGSAIQFGVSILYIVLFVPCSFCLWYWPTYKAFRDDSSFNFMVYFFCFFFQIIFCFLYSLGLSDLGTCGWLNAATVSQSGKQGAIPISIIMFVIATLFTINGLLMIIMLKKIHRMYRTAGASLEKAQQEFAGNVMTNPNVQSAAADAAAAGVRAAASNRK